MKAILCNRCKTVIVSEISASGKVEYFMATMWLTGAKAQAHFRPERDYSNGCTLDLCPKCFDAFGKLMDDFLGKAPQQNA